MALYEYRCEQDGVFEIMRPLGTAPPSVPCGVCGSQALRVISVPRILTGTRTAWMAAMDHSQKSRYEPEVVSTLPSAGAPRRSRTLQMTPALQRLPRP
jgi:putative FmdB family regulatory protein